MDTQAQALAWGGRTAAPEGLYDTVLARFPDRPDALAGRARAIAWSGDLARAEQLWRAALTRGSGAVVAKLAPAQTYAWPTWEVPTWQERLKPAYFTMHDVWGSW